MSLAPIRRAQARFRELGTGPAIQWMTPASGLWVATRRGEYAGMVERIDGRYHVRNPRGREVGPFDDLDAARAAIDGDGEEGAAARRALRLTGMMIAVNGAMVGVAAGLAALLLR